MGLSPGTKLDRYEIRSMIGAGGMGEVYRARDERLNRDVAIKVLPTDLSTNGDRLNRFEQEAQAAGALNHPNILAVYDIGMHKNAPYVVSELLEGATLGDMLDERSIGTSKAIEYAIQMAQGLSAAHDSGIVHRDLKPDNLFITKDDRVKILDFGLAKLVETTDMVRTDIATRKVLTLPGTVMGTAAYMSPEQVKGDTVDHRSDIFSFGSILYEMVSGQRAFRRETTAETMTAILREEPPEFTSTDSSIGPSLQRIARRCLEKQPARRFQTASDLGFALEALSASSSPTLQATSPALPDITRITTVVLAKREWTAWVAAGVLLLLSVALLWFTFTRSRQPGAESSRVVRYEISTPDKTALNLIRWPSIALSPDGSTVVFVGTINGIHRLYVRRRDETAIKPITGTEGASTPVFSPDGKWIAFLADRTLKKAALDGQVTSVLKVDDARGIGWASDDSLVYTPDAAEGLFQISSEGGQPKRITKPDPAKNERSHRWLEVLPGGKAAIFTVGTLNSPDSYEKANIDAVNLSTGERHVVVPGASMARYSPTGHLVFARGGSLYALGFDLEKLSTNGKPQLILQGVAGDETTGVAHFTIANDGTLAYVPGSPGANMRRIVWVDRTGKVEPLSLEPAQNNDVRISPDSSRAAVLIGSSGAGDVWVYDLSRATSTRLTFNGMNATPLWSSDGKSIYYIEMDPRAAGKSVVMRKPADGSRDAEALMSVDGTAYIKALMPDGITGIFDYQRSASHGSIVQSKLEQGATLTELVETQFADIAAALAPDGRWLAYQSNESDRPQIYVREMSGTGARWQISTEGGEEPRWSRDGRELYYRNGNLFMSVAISTSPSFHASKPTNLFGGVFDLRTNTGITYDVDPKGNRFLMLRPAEESTAPSVMIVLNWFDELRRLVPTPE
jgi:serine/threonine protein kinase/Tol biopolymer transport system component